MNSISVVGSSNLLQLGWACSSLMFDIVVTMSSYSPMGRACSSLMLSSQQSNPDTNSSTKVTIGLVVRQEKSPTGLLFVNSSHRRACSSSTEVTDGLVVRQQKSPTGL